MPGNSTFRFFFNGENDVRLDSKMGGKVTDIKFTEVCHSYLSPKSLFKFSGVPVL